MAATPNYLATNGTGGTIAAVAAGVVIGGLGVAAAISVGAAGGGGAGVFPPPQITTAPVITSATAGQPITYTSGQSTSLPTPAIVDYLYDNGTLVATGSTAILAYTSTSAGDVLIVQSIPTNINGTGSASNSAPFTVANGPFLLETFTGTPGTAITSITPTIGGTWTVSPTFSPASPNAIDAAGTAIYAPTASGVYYNTAVPPGADYYVEAVFVCRSVISTDAIRITGRADSAVNTCYMCGYAPVSGGVWVLYKVIAGTATQIGANFADPTFTAGQTRTVRLTMTGTTISMSINGTVQVSVTDSAVTAKGFAGVRQTGSAQTSTTGYHIASINGLGLSAAPSFAGQTPSIVTNYAGLAQTGTPISYTTITATGIPTATIQYDLWKNGSVFMAAYAQGAYTPTATGDTYQIVATASNGVAPNATASSAVLTAATVYAAALVASPIVGKAMRYTLPASAPTVSTQQWANNAAAGAGPVAISGATSANYTPVSGDTAKYISVSGRLSDGSYFFSPQFTSAPGYATRTVPTTPIPSSGNGQNIGAVQSSNWTTWTFNAPMSIRFYVGGYYEDRLIAPGGYSAYSAYWPISDLSPYGASSGIQRNILPNSGYPATLAQQAAYAGTATRPAGNTGSGPFVSGGALYDRLGVYFMPRGINRAHYDAYPPGQITCKANAVRLFTYLSVIPWSTNQTIFNTMVSAQQIPICTPGGWSVFNADISAGSMTVNSFSAGSILIVGDLIRLQSAGPSGSVVCHITSVPAGNGTGVYGIDNSSISYTATDFNGTNSTTGKVDALYVTRCANNIVENRANLSAYDTNMILNIANEWGPLGTSSNTVWRDAYIAAVASIRAAGFMNPIMIDAPVGGQDNSGVGVIGVTFTTVNVADGKTYTQNVWESDAARNIIFSYHVYGNAQPGDFAGLAAKMYALSASTGMCFMVGEFGPTQISFNGGSLTMTQPLEVQPTCEAYRIGYCAWAIDDSAGTLFKAGEYALVMNAGNYNAGGGGFQSGITGCVSGFTLVGGSGYTDGSYLSKVMTGGHGSGCYANIIISGGIVTSVVMDYTLTSALVTGGHGYQVGDSLTYASGLGAGTGFSITVTSITSFPNGNPAELTTFGQQFILDAVYGIQANAVPATAF